jgi:DNA (cytosine-5)-methyltransferase 1
MPTFGSLFAGIGGIDLGLERAGWECRWQVEWDEFCQHVLAHHWPDVPRYGDISAVDWAGVEPVDLLAGGFPCQPFSFAGKQQRMADDRWLWPEFARAVRELRPRYVLVENVPGLLVGGGMDAVLGELAELGYDAEWESIPASAVGAPHLRYRVWVVAYASGSRRREDAGGASGDEGADAGWPSHDDHIADRDGQGNRARPVADANGNEHQGDGPPQRWARTSDVANPFGQRGRGGHARREDATDADASGEGIGPGGHGGWWATEPNVGRVAHGVSARVDRLRALGNAVVPQVVEVIGRQLLAAIEDRAA